MKKITNTILIFAFSIFYLGNISAQIVINEYSCANLNSFADNYNDYEDWVELHNVSNQPVNIGGYYLSDNPDNPDRWKIPVGTTISANGFLLFWASGRDTTINNNFHLNFKIIQTKSTPESFVLANANAEIIDMVEIKKTKLGHARGRMTDGAATWRILTQPSPDASNNNSPKFSAYADRPTFDLDPGFYQNSITVTIENNEPGTAIYYTIDGTEPTQESPVYTAPLVLSQTTVLKSIAVSSDTTMLNSFIEFSTFFINVSHTLPVFSVSANQLLELANGNNELRPYGAIEYFALNGERKGNSYGELNSHGQDSWVNDQRSIDWVSRDEMGYSSVLEERLFSMSDRERFQRFILRAAGDDNYPGNFLPEHNGCAHIRDAYVHNLAKRGGLKLDVRVSEKVILYLNGQYWGVYDVREIPDDHDYTDYYYNQGKYDIQYILTWGQTWAQYGGNEALQNWQTLRNYVLTNDMSIQEKFDNVAAQLDVESLVDYVLVNSVTVCSDWLNYNTGWWRGLKESAKHKKWGYILWDNDATFGYYINYTGIPDTSATAAPCDAESLTNPDVDLNSHIRILNKLRQNVAFNQYYISRQIDLMNTVFSCDNM
ncbi:MAG: chitobiase/beta-hexosaminidase C-terminal domain-containing protein, partial [Saprospiraceae bacterium]